MHNIERSQCQHERTANYCTVQYIVYSTVVWHSVDWLTIIDIDTVTFKQKYIESAQNNGDANL